MNVGVFGSASGTLFPKIKENARKIGMALAQRNHAVITGACNGFPQDAVLGAYETQGACIGFSPATCLESHKNHNLPSKGFSKLIFIDPSFKYSSNYSVCSKLRNVLSTAFVDAGIIVGGKIGTMNEFTLLYDMGKNIGVLEGSGGITNKAISALLDDAKKESVSKIIYDSDPCKLVKKIERITDKNRFV